MRGDALVVVLLAVTVLVRPLQPAVPRADPGAGSGGLGLSDQSSEPTVRTCLALLPVFLLSAGSVWPGRLVGDGVSSLRRAVRGIRAEESKGSSVAPRLAADDDGGRHHGGGGGRVGGGRGG